MSLANAAVREENRHASGHTRRLLARGLFQGGVLPMYLRHSMRSQALSQDALWNLIGQ